MTPFLRAMSPLTTEIRCVRRTAEAIMLMKRTRELRNEHATHENLDKVCPDLAATIRIWRVNMNLREGASELRTSVHVQRMTYELVAVASMHLRYTKQ